MSSFINIMEASQQESTVKDTPSEEPEQKTVDIMDMEITSENVALNVLVTFVNLAQKRGAYKIKIGITVDSMGWFISIQFKYSNVS